MSSISYAFVRSVSKKKKLKPPPPEKRHFHFHKEQFLFGVIKNVVGVVFLEQKTNL